MSDGLSPEHRQRLRELAQDANDGGQWSTCTDRCCVGQHKQGGTLVAQKIELPEWAAFIAAADPSTVLSVLDALDRATAERDALQRTLDNWCKTWPAAGTRVCYECGRWVDENAGEQHGRSGWVHFSCVESFLP